MGNCIDKFISNRLDKRINELLQTRYKIRQRINEREQLGENGFVYISLLIDKEKADIVGRTKIITRGTLYVKSSTDIISDIRRIVHGLVLFTIKNSNDWTSSKLKKYIQERVKSYFYKTKRRSPYVCISIQYLDDLKFVTIPKEVNA